MSEYNEKENADLCDEKNNDSSDKHIESDKSAEPKPPIKVSLQSFIISTVALVLAAVMVTYSLCSTMYKKVIDEAYLGNLQYGTSDDYDKLDLVRAIFQKYSYLEINDEEQLDAVIRAYVAETGDRYAVYYNAEEYAHHLESAAGNSVGVGVTITGGSITVDGVDYTVIDIIEVVEGGPADLAGIKVGDKIAWIGSAEDNKLVGEMSSYGEAVNSLLGDAGTAAEFGVFRESGAGYEKIFFSVIRKYIDRQTVT